MATNPGKSIPQMFDRTYDVKAAYSLFAHKQATPERLQEGHRDGVRREIHKPGTYLLIEDTSHVIWPGKQMIAGLGPIGRGDGKLQGFLLHTVLAAHWRPFSCKGPSDQGHSDKDHSPDIGARAAQERRPAVNVIGLLHQQYHLRQPRPEQEPVGDSRARQKRLHKHQEESVQEGATKGSSRQAEPSTRREENSELPLKNSNLPLESHLWLRSSQAIGPASASDVVTDEVRWVRVADRGADIYEFLVECGRLGHGFVVRAAQDRRVGDVHSDGQKSTLLKTTRAQAEWGSFQLSLRKREGQPAREATLSVSATPVVLLSPRRVGHSPDQLTRVQCTAIRVWEANPEEGIQEPLEWILLCDRPVRTFDEALEPALQYSARWLIEEFHKALKTGLGAEKLQLDNAARIFAAIAIMSVVAVRLVALREHSRLEPEAPAETSGLSDLELNILRVKLKRSIKTVREVSLAVSRLGGHMNRKGDGPPGWITLWRGMQKLDNLAEGARLALSC